MINKKKLYAGVAVAVISGMLSSVATFGTIDSDKQHNDPENSNILFSIDELIMFKTENLRHFSKDSFLNIRNLPSTYFASTGDDRDANNRSAPREEENVIKLGDTSEFVSQLQTNLQKLGFYTLDITGYFGEVTKSAVSDFQKSHGLTVTGTGNKETLDKINYFISNNMTIEARAAAAKAKAQAQVASAPKATPTPTPTKKPSSAQPSNPTPNIPAPPAIGGSASMLPWFGNAQNVFSIGSVATVTDLLSGRTFRVKRTYGYNHADVETLTSQDTATLKSILGGSWSWVRRPIKVSVNGTNIAASMAAVPHAGRDDKPANANVSDRSGDYGYGENLDAVKGNNMDGVIDFHFYGSKTHGSSRVDADHQDAVRRAFEMCK